MIVWVVSKNGMLANAIRTCLENKNIKYIATSKNEVDILDLSQVKDFVNNNSFTHIINCAAYTNVDKAESEKKTAYAINVTGVQNLAIVAKHEKIKLVHYSTDYVFDGSKKEPYLETDKCCPINYYGHTKNLSEKIIEDILSDYLIIRTSWLFGHKKINFPSKIFSLMQIKTSISVVEDQVGRVTFCEDLAEATLVLLDQCGIFNFANEGVASWYDYALTIFKNLKNKKVRLMCREIKPIKTDQLKVAAQRPRYSALSTKKFSSACQLKIRSSLECIKQYFEQEYGIY